MPRTRSAVNRRTSTTKKAKTNSPTAVPKPSREQKAKVVKKPRPKKGKETSDDSTASPISVGSKIPWTNDFGGAIYLHDGTKTSLKQLVEESHNGVIACVYPKPLDDEDEYDLHGELDHAQLDLEAAAMSSIGIVRDSVSSIAAAMEGPGEGVPLASNPDGSLMKAMSITSAKGVPKQGGFIISKEGILLARTIGNTDKVMNDLFRVLSPLMEERLEALDEEDF